MRPALSFAARLRLAVGVSTAPLRRQAAPAVRLPARRALSSTPPRASRYDRFDTQSYGQPGSAKDGVMNFLRRRLGGDRAILVYGIGIGGGVIYYIAHLERVPGTGRLRFMDCTPEQEKEMGADTFAATMGEFRGKILPPNHPITRRVREVATRIVERNGLGRIKASHTLGAVEGVVPSWGGGGGALDPDSNWVGGASESNEWEVYVVADPKVPNAFVIPGGKIFVFTGILPISANDDGLATVMGHEVAHVVARHGAERMSSMKVLFGISFLLESLGLDVGLTRMLVMFMLQLPNSRTNESEADTIGLQLMSRACFDPAEAPKMWERMSELAGGGGIAGKLDFWSTHPANQKRIKALTKELPEAEALRHKVCPVNQKRDFEDMQSFSKAFGFGNSYVGDNPGPWQ